MRKIIIPAAALVLVSTAAFAASAPAPTAPTSAQLADQSMQKVLDDITTIRAASDAATDADFQAFRMRFATLYQEAKADAAAQHKADQDALQAANKKTDDAHKDAVISQHDRDNAKKLLDADQKTIADLRKQVADKTQALAQGAKMCLRQSEPALPHSVPARR